MGKFFNCLTLLSLLLWFAACSPQDLAPDLAAPPPPEDNGEVTPTMSQADVIDYMATVFAQYSQDYTTPDEVTLPSGDKLSKADYYGYAMQVVIDLNRDSIGRAQPIQSWKAPESPDLDGFTDATVSKAMVVNHAERQLAYAASHEALFANYVGYPGTFGQYNGNFSFNRGVVVTARVLDYYKKNKALPAEVSSAYKYEAPPADPTKVKTADAISAIAALLAAFETNKTLPDSMMIGTVKYGKSQYVEIAARIIQDPSVEEITVVSYAAPENPANDTFVNKDGSEVTELPFDLIQNQITRQLTYANNNKVFANYAGYPNASYNGGADTYSGFFSYNRFAVALVRVLAYYKEHNAMPDKVSAVYKAAEGEVNPNVLKKADILNAIATSVYGQWEKDKTVPDTITINTLKYGKSQYFEAACRVFQDTAKAEITLTNYAKPDDPDNASWETFTLKDGSAVTTVPLALLQNNVTRQMTYAGTNGKFANLAGYPNASYNSSDDTYKGNFTYNRCIVVVARVLTSYKNDGKFPDPVPADYQ